MTPWATTAALCAACALAGFAAGWLHFRSLQWLAARMIAGDPAAAALQLARLAAVAAFLYLCARGGAGALLSAATGLFAERALVLAQTRKQIS